MSDIQSTDQAVPVCERCGLDLSTTTVGYSTVNGDIVCERCDAAEPGHVLDLLQATRDLIAERSAWTKRASARAHAGGLALSACATTAKCWCLLGALTMASRGPLESGEPMSEHVPGEAQARNEARALRAIGEAIARWRCRRAPAPVDDPLNEVVQFNDAPGRKHPEVLAVLDSAVEAQRAAYYFPA